MKESMGRDFGLSRKVAELTAKYGPTTRFAVNILLQTFVPGSREVIEAIDRGFETAQDTASGKLAADTNLGSLATKEQIDGIIELLGRVEETNPELFSRLTALEAVPEQANILLAEAARTNAFLQEFLGRQRRGDSQLEKMASHIEVIAQSVQRGREDDMTLLILDTSKRAESHLKEEFGADGRGLGEFLASSSSPLRAADRQLFDALKKFIPIRNKVFHHEEFSFDLDEVEALCTKIKERLDATNPKSSASKPRLVTSSREIFVSRIGIGDAVSISDAIHIASSGDTIYIPPGNYEETLFIDKALTLKGQPTETEPVRVNSGGDIVQIVSDNVKVSGLEIISQGEGAFGIIVFPRHTNIELSGCAFHNPGGTSLFGLFDASVSVSGCRFSGSRIACRAEGYLLLDTCNFREHPNALVVRRESQTIVRSCTFEACNVCVMLQGSSNAEIHANIFRDGEFGIVADGDPSGRIYDNIFDGFDENARTFRYQGGERLRFE